MYSAVSPLYLNSTLTKEKDQVTKMIKFYELAYESVANGAEPIDVICLEAIKANLDGAQSWLHWLNSCPKAIASIKMSPNLLKLFELGEGKAASSMPVDSIVISHESPMSVESLSSYTDGIRTLTQEQIDLELPNADDKITVQLRAWHSKASGSVQSGRMPPCVIKDVDVFRIGVSNIGLPMTQLCPYCSRPFAQHVPRKVPCSYLQCEVRPCLGPLGDNRCIRCGMLTKDHAKGASNAANNARKRRIKDKGLDLHHLDILDVNTGLIIPSLIPQNQQPPPFNHKATPAYAHEHSMSILQPLLSPPSAVPFIETTVFQRIISSDEHDNKVNNPCRDEFDALI